MPQKDMYSYLIPTLLLVAALPVTHCLEQSIEPPELNWSLEFPLPGLAPNGLQTTTSWVLAIMRLLGTAATLVVFVVEPLLKGIFTAADDEKRSGHGLSPGLTSLTRLLERFSTKYEENMSEAGRLLLDRDNCVELISCTAKKYMRRSSEAVTFWYTQMSSKPRRNSTQPSMHWRSRAFQNTEDDCANYRCNPFGFIFRLFLFLMDWNTLFKA